MATTESFNSMLKRHMPYQLLVEEIKKKNYFWNKVKKDEGWMGGTLDVPFEGAEASSLAFGALTADSDIAENAEVLGTISTMPELWGTMLFNEKDLDRHQDMEKSFLQLLPGKLNQFIGRMTERVSLSLLNGYIDTFRADTDLANGIIGIYHPERFTIGEKVTIDDDNSSSAEYYIIAIDMINKTITVSATRGGAAANVAAYTTAQNGKIYLVDGDTAGFSSLGSSLLSAANGGSATLYGQTKTAYPFLQAQNFSGASITGTNILEKMFESFFDTLALGKGNPTTILCSLGDHFKFIAKGLEDSRAFVTSDKAAGYGWRSVKLLGTDGEMEIVGLRDMAADKAFIIDWDAMKFHGNNFFERKRHKNGDEFFLTRATTGYKYIVDVKFYGDLVVNHPSHCGVIHSIPQLS